jgi:hypothetical protein
MHSLIRYCFAVAIGLSAPRDAGHGPTPAALLLERPPLRAYSVSAPSAVHVGALGGPTQGWQVVSPLFFLERSR